MLTQAEKCVRPNADGRTGVPQEFELADTSHVLAYFSFEWGNLDEGEYGLLHLQLDDEFPGAGDLEFHPGARSGTVMWSFPNVAAGTHTVSVYTAVAKLRNVGHVDLRASLSNCALTLLVMPVAA